MQKMEHSIEGVLSLQLEKHSDERGTRLVSVFGVHSVRDRENAQALADIVPVQLVPISDPETEVKHNPLHFIATQGRLGEFVAEKLFVPPNRPAGW